MKHAFYVGSLRHLRGKGAAGALIRDGASPDRVLAQFDNRLLTRSGRPFPTMTELEYEPHARYPTERQVDYPTPPEDCLGFGWHEFDRSDFAMDEETP